MARSLGAGHSQYRRRPSFLLETLKVRFLAAGGCLFENTPFEGQWFTGWRARGSRAEFQNAVVSRCDGAFFCDDAAASAAGKNMRLPGGGKLCPRISQK